ncbi:MAG TPA: restriction endonuclease subunit S [Kiritimatiellia bacterium]|nr:restriction endonuclease subunit S [Kiritimatiellia bacterium]
MKKGWETKNLGDLCDILDHKRKPITKRDRIAGDYPYYGATGILDHVAGYLFDEPLVLLGEDGAKWESGENTAFPVSGKIWVNNHAHVLRPHRMELLDNWLIHYLNHSDLNEFVSGLTVPKLNQGNMREIPIPLPPLPEQKRIVGILDEAFAGIATAKANAEKNLQNARALFESHLNDVFTKRGKGWVEKRLDDVCVIGDGNHSSNYPKKEELVAAGVPFIRATNLVGGQISDDDMRYLSPEKHAQLKKGHLKTGDVLFTNRGEIGKTAIVDRAHDGSNLNSQIAWFRCRNELCNRFLFYVLNSGKMKMHINLSQNGAALQQFTIRQIKELQIPVPPQTEQLTVVKKIDQLSKEVDHLEFIYQHKLDELDALKKSLLHQAFTGAL